jgi:signal peptide peptidase SppA
MSTNLLPKGEWFGTDDSLKIVIDMAMNMEASIKSQGLPQLAFGEDDEEELPRLLTIADNTAVISIAGSLVNNASFWNRYFGVTGYPEIKEALIHAANDETVDNIVLQIDSGGGTVSGVFELARFIKEVDEKIKPIESINTGVEASAAYLLGSQARTVHAQEMSQTGSIGVIMVHQEYSKFFKEKGIETTVIRAGSHKALVNPYEPLTDAAKADMQKTADFIHDKFIETVADGRGMSFTNVRDNMADGSIFFTEEAMRLGLVDNITSIDKLVAELNERQSGSTGGFGLQVGGLPAVVGLESS